MTKQLDQGTLRKAIGTALQLVSLTNKKLDLMYEMSAALVSQVTPTKNMKLISLLHRDGFMLKVSDQMYIVYHIADFQRMRDFMKWDVTPSLWEPAKMLGFIYDNYDPTDPLSDSRLRYVAVDRKRLITVTTKVNIAANEIVDWATRR